MQHVEDLEHLYPLLEAIVAFMDEGVIIANEDGTVLYQNPAASEMLGAAKGEPIRHLSNACRFDLQRALSDPTGESGGGRRRSAPGPGFTRFERRIDGSEVPRHLEFHSGLVSVPHAEMRLRVVISQDRTAQRQLEAAMKRAGTDLITKDPEMLDILARLEQVAPTDAFVLLQGESGTGKTQIARLIHRMSNRAHGPLIEVNCAAIPETLMESELFGHVKGAFTGAIQDRPGRFQAANGGTLFMDEISEIPLHLQAKLLRAIQEGAFEPVGSDRTQRVNLRIISASNRNVREMVDAGDFRADLYYRLAVIPIHLPPLRDRPGDIPLLLDHFCHSLQGRGYPRDVECTPEAMRLMMNYSWPGNVREMENAVEHAVICAIDNQVVPESLPQDIRATATALPRLANGNGDDDVQRREILDALELSGGNRGEAARLLNVDRTTLWRRMGRLGMV